MTNKARAGFLILVTLALVNLLMAIEPVNASQPLVLEAWAHEAGPDENGVIKESIDAFNKAHAEIQVKLTVVPRDIEQGYEMKVTTAAKAGKLPDLLDIDGPMTAVYADVVFAPLDPYISKEVRSDFTPGHLFGGTWRNKLYTLGIFETSVALYYNVTMLRNAGISVPTEVDRAWTWDEFENVCKKLTTPDRVAVDFGVTRPSEWYMYALGCLVYQNGGTYLSPDGKKASGYLNSDKAVAAWQWFQGLFAKGYSKILPTGGGFVDGKVPLHWNGAWAPNQYGDYPNLQWGCMPLPRQEKWATPCGSWRWGISATTKHPQQAWQVLEWLTGPDTQAKMAKVMGLPPARKSVFARIPGFDVLPNRIIRDQLFETSVPRPVTPVYPTLSRLMNQAIQDIVLGKDVRKALDEVAVQVNQELSLQ